jgi:hypothetical protein
MWTLLGLSLATGCFDHTPLGPARDVVVVQAVLNSTRSVQHIEVRHTGSDLTGGVPVHGATVTLIAPDGAVHAASEVPSPSDPQGTNNFAARYDVAVGELTVGKPYHLRVVTTNGTITEGDAIVPATPPPQLMAERRFDLATDTLRFAWPRVTGAQAYEVRIVPQLDSTNVIYTDPYGQVYYGGYAAGGFLAYVDTSVAVAGTARQHNTSVFQPGGRYVVIVSAVDDHYYDYFSRESDPYSATPLPSSLRGGVGVFGAIVPILQQTIVVEGSTPGP